MRAERGGEGRAPIEQLAGPGGVSGDAEDAESLEHADRLSEDCCRVERVPRDDRHHDVQLELTGVGRGQDCGVAADDLAADLVDHLRNRWIDLARHDRGARLHGGELDFGDAGTRPHAEEPQVGGDLGRLDREPSQRSRIGEHVSHALRDPEAVGRAAKR